MDILIVVLWFILGIIGLEMGISLAGGIEKDEHWVPWGILCGPFMLLVVLLQMAENHLRDK